ncbi:MAG TPA: UDP-N-acetylmuramoyl-L-alanyl-D-glutamate--2,6-diaminopimelate ligase [Burkholderiales bacterium]|nr:UDP-N-acetylmuramoyl-L-alanyl-D-glutamate--2,6-diaminopimelate ligase [Burkholderiales bacterium]
MIERLSSDSRRCAPGVAFFAYPGEAADGRAHIAGAISRGASAVLWEEQGFSWRGEWRVPNIAVRGLKLDAGRLAHEFYGRPSEALWMCGVTGTNGKTSCSQWIAALLANKSIKTAVIGTLGSGYPGALAEASNTTPDTLELHRMLKDFLAGGAKCVAMEVSSHGLTQGRVNGVAFDCALFTNLSHDHLDYHGSMEAYAAAKARLFDTPGLGAAVLNLDDGLGVLLAQRLTARGVRTIGYTLCASAVARGNVTEFIAATTIAGRSLQLHSSWGNATATVNQLGRFNLSNALGVLGCLVAYGMPFHEAAGLLGALPSVPGRMQKIGDRPLVVVDYAHTPDALEKVLQALRPVTKGRGGRLVAVFGAGGDRDASKRPRMGAIAAHLADQVIVTSDNPRSEDPLAIIAAVSAGIPGTHATEPDRARAIEKAVAEAAPVDVVLIAGKGHENYQEIAGKRLPFSDAAVARAALARRGAG